MISPNSVAFKQKMVQRLTGWVGRTRYAFARRTAWSSTTRNMPETERGP